MCDSKPTPPVHSHDRGPAGPCVKLAVLSVLSIQEAPTHSWAWVSADATCVSLHYTKLYKYRAGIREVLMVDRDEQLKISSTGLKLFERQEAKVTLCQT